jgi:signal transduction histidine kinase
LAGVFGHASGTPLVDLNSNIQLASTLITEHIRPDLRHLETAAATGKLKEIGSALDATRDKLTRAEATLTRLSAIHSQISTLTRSFVNDINSYARPGQLDLRTLVESAVGLANSALIAKASKNIRIEFLKDSTAPRPTVFCSTLLKQHLYSILHNSVLSILDRLHSDPSPGVITIGISKHTPPASQEVTLNESWAVRIKDNGSGVTRAELEKLRRFQPGLRFRESTGHGHGLTAAQRYMASIDGRVELDSEKEKFFEVILHFPVSQDAQKAVASVETHTNA